MANKIKTAQTRMSKTARINRIKYDFRSFTLHTTMRNNKFTNIPIEKREI